jgi:signal transduction histidine kinase
VRASTELGQDMSPEQVAAKAARLAADFADYASVELFEEDGSLVRRAAYHPDVACQAYLTSHLDMRVSGPGDVSEILQLLQARSIVFAPGGRLPRFLDLDGPVLPTPLQPVTVAIVPLTATGHTLGMIRVYATSANGAAQLSAWAALLEAFAGYVSMTLASAKLLQEAERGRLAAEESGRGRTRAMAGLSHELRTPLHSILGYSELLLDGVSGPLGEKTEQFVRSIRGSAMHQSGLVDDILSLSRTGRSPRFAPAQLEVAVIVAECVGMVAERARANRLELHVDVAADAKIFTDRSKLSQVLINLLGNAVKFTRDGEVWVTAVQSEGRITFEIRDTGCGITAAELPHIFEPFWQGKASETDGGEGTGLGLSLVQRLVAVLGGSLSVESEESVGTTFRFDLPVVCPDTI